MGCRSEPRPDPCAEPARTGMHLHRRSAATPGSRPRDQLAPLVARSLPRLHVLARSLTLNVSVPLIDEDVPSCPCWPGTIRLCVEHSIRELEVALTSGATRGARRATARSSTRAWRH